jgi:transketolase
MKTTKDWHSSQRGWFGGSLYLEMEKDRNIWLLVGDLGYKVFDKHFKDFPERVINVGASEQSMLDIAVGLALEGKTAIAYSITPFLIYRAFETVRTYIDHEKIPVKLIGSGQGKDYAHDGYSHDATDIPAFMKQFKNIKSFYPKKKEEIPALVTKMITDPEPYFINLKR